MSIVQVDSFSPHAPQRPDEPPSPRRRRELATAANSSQERRRRRSAFEAAPSETPPPIEIAFLVSHGTPLVLLQYAGALARRHGVSADKVLIAEGLMSEDNFYRTLAAHLGVWLSRRPRSHHRRRCINRRGARLCAACRQRAWIALGRRAMRSRDRAIDRGRRRRAWSADVCNRRPIAHSSGARQRPAAISRASSRLFRRTRQSRTFRARRIGPQNSRHRDCRQRRFVRLPVFSFSARFSCRDARLCSLVLRRRFPASIRLRRKFQRRRAGGGDRRGAAPELFAHCPALRRSVGRSAIDPGDRAFGLSARQIGGQIRRRAS